MWLPVGEESREPVLTTKLMVPMRDDVHLAVTVYRPDAGDTYPAVLTRTPYSKDSTETLMLETGVTTARAGYVRVDQDVRGRFDSAGEFNLGRDDVDDAFDTIEWIITQPWSNGDVVIVGDSAVGFTSWRALASRHPAIKAFVVSDSGGPFDGLGFYAAGKAQLDVMYLWAGVSILQNVLERTGSRPDDADLQELFGPTTPADKAAALNRFVRRPMYELTDLISRYTPWVREWASHPDPEDAFWASLDTRHIAAGVGLPGLHMGNWPDLFIRGTIRSYVNAVASGAPQRLVVGPYTHLGAAPSDEPVPPVVFDDIRFLNRAAAPTPQPVREWLDEQVTDGPVSSRAPLSLYVQRANRWREAERWPLPETQWTRLYLHSAGAANSAGGDGTLSGLLPLDERSDHYSYDPGAPVPAAGGTFLEPQLALGFVDQAEIESRDDVLVYTGERSESGFEITGPVTVELWVTTSAVDTDFTAKLTDVHPDGTSTNVCDGVTRLQYRPERKGLVEPGSRQFVTIELSPTSYFFRPGHAVRLQISSSNFPLFDANPNTGVNHLVEPTAPVVAHQTIFHDSGHPSFLVLPVIPDDSSQHGDPIRDARNGD